MENIIASINIAVPTSDSKLVECLGVEREEVPFVDGLFGIKED
jgi:hypothetical protein